MRRTKLILLVLVALGAIAAGYGLWEYNRGLSDAGAEEPVARIEASALLQEFSADEAAANARFNGKAVQVTGIVKEVTAPAAGPTTVSLETGDPLSLVICESDDGRAAQLKAGNKVTLKGFCAGYNLDVLLQRCVIVE
ncbi:MAG: hypothetical protein H6595_13665 [Flavobacteriales bacterium]|nr:hypothetical protein [Flavobacteriales bacterium]MCB9168513.1 hypothetical protein [Flavobacteriales bacterium]